MSYQLIRLLRSATGDGAADADLLAAFADGRDPAAFAALVRRHGPMVLGTCRRILRHEQDAEDAFQATFLVLARRAADVWPRSAVGPWLHGVAFRVANKSRALRAARKCREGTLPVDVVAATIPLPEPDLAGLIDHAVRRLPAVYRAAVVACDLEGLNRADAAARLGWKEGTLSGRLARGRRLLADRLRGQGVTLPAAGLAALIGADGSAGAVPVRLIERTVELSGWQAIAVPSTVAALTTGVIRTMIAAKVRFAAATLATMTIAGFGVWSVAVGGGQEGKPSGGLPTTKTEATPKPVAPAVKSEDDAIEKELRALAGVWRLTGEINGSGREVEKLDTDEMLLTITGREMVFSLGNKSEHAKHRIERIDLGESPKEIDIRDLTGRSNNELTKCIYELKDDAFYLCSPTSRRKGRRPTNFLTTHESGTDAMVFRRRGSVAEQMSSLQGLWTVKRMTANGKEVDKDIKRTLRWVIHQDELLMIDGSDVGKDTKMKIRLSAAKSWTEIDLTVVAGAPQSLIGQVLPGICERKGNELTVFLQGEPPVGEKQRPAELKDGKGVMMMVLEKVVFREAVQPPPKALPTPASSKP